MARCSPLPGAPGRLAEKSGTNLGALPGPCDSERETVRIELIDLLFRRLHLQSPIQARTSTSANATRPLRHLAPPQYEVLCKRKL